MKECKKCNKCLKGTFCCDWRMPIESPELKGSCEHARNNS